MKTSSGRPVQRRSARSRGRSRRSRRRGVVRARRRGDRGTVAASSTVNGGEHARAEGIEGEREMDLAGERRRGRGSEQGEWERGPRRRGPLAPLSSPASVPARGSGGSAPLFRPGRGNREGAREEVGWAGGAGVRGCGPVWAGGVRCRWATGPVGGGGLLLLLSFSVLFSVFSFLFISFSVLFHFKAFRHFIKMCSLHHNYQCNIWHPLNIFV